MGDDLDVLGALEDRPEVVFKYKIVEISGSYSKPLKYCYFK